MAKIIVQQKPRIYSFVINNMEFICQAEFEDEASMQPINILIKDLQNCIEQLKRMTQLKLKDDNSEDKKI